MRHSNISLWSEQRLLGFATEQQKRVESALDSVSTATARPVSSGNLTQELDRLNTWASTEVTNVKPSIKAKMGRYLLGATASAVGKEGAFYDATTKEVESAIDRLAYQQMLIAEKQLNDEEHGSLEKIQALSRKTKLSAGFLKHKSEICAGLKTDLQKQKAEKIDTFNANKNLRGFDKSQLKTSIEALKEKLDAVTKVDKDTIGKLEGSMVGQMHHDIDKAVGYFTETCGAYAPELLGDVRVHIQSYVQGDTRDLEGLIGDLAKAMYPDDQRLQTVQIASMKRIAEKMTGNQGGWRNFRRRFTEIAPAVAAGTGVGLLTGGAAFAPYLVGGLVGGSAVAIRTINNKFRYGTKSRRDFEKSQAASYFNSIALNNVKKISKLKEAKTLPERLKLLDDAKEFPNGMKIKVDIAGDGMTELTLSTIKNGARLASSTSGRIFALDLAGSSNKFLAVIKNRDGTKATKKLTLFNDSASDCVFSLND